MTLKALKPLSPETPGLANVETGSGVETSKPAEVPPQLMTNDALLLVIAQMQKNQADSNKAIEALSAAILETTKPRETPKTKEQIARAKNDEMFRESERLLEKRKKENTKISQSICDHIAGCMEGSEQRDIAGRTAYVWHRTDVGADVGICSVCGDILYPGMPEYAKWRKKPSFNKLSAAGFRTMADPNKARKDAFLVDS